MSKCLQATKDSPWQLTKADDKQRYELLTSPSIGRELYRSERVTIDLIPYTITTENYKIITENENPHVIVETSGGHYISVSFGTARGCANPARLCYTVNIYTNDADKAAAHLQHQIADAVTSYPDKEISFSILSDVSFTEGSREREILIEAARMLGLVHPLEDDYKNFHLIIVKLNNFADIMSTPSLSNNMQVISKI